MKRAYKAAALASMILVTLLLALSISSGGMGNGVPYPTIRNLAFWYLKTTYNPFLLKVFSAAAPEAVTAIVWDYRGLDTLFETSVFFLAIVASLAIMRGIKIEVPRSFDPRRFGMSPIVKTVTKIMLGLIIAVSASIALHGQLTPGGGFQGGSAAAVAPLIAIVIFSVYFTVRSGVRKESMLALRTAGLIGIGVTSFLAILIGIFTHRAAFIFQNQPKSTAPTGLPNHILGVPMGGTLWLFNIFEYLAVAAGFTIVFLLLSVPESVVRKHLKKEVEGGGENGG